MLPGIALKFLSESFEDECRCSQHKIMKVYLFYNLLPVLEAYSLLEDIFWVEKDPPKNIEMAGYM
jgi:hypothetical protein